MGWFKITCLNCNQEATINDEMAAVDKTHGCSDNGIDIYSVIINYDHDQCTCIDCACGNTVRFSE